MPTGEAHSFSASWDRMTQVITAVVFVLLAVVVVVTRSAMVAGLETVLFFVAYAYSPQSYALLDRTLIVKRLVGSVRIPLDGIREARAAGADDFTGCIRLFGSGGLFGWYGLFRTSKLGKCSWYVTNRKNSVVLVTGAKTAVVSPDDVDGFVATVREAMPQAAPADPALAALGTYDSGNLPGTLIGWAVGIVAVGVVGFAMLYSPGPPSYSLTPGSLTIRDRFYPVTVNAASVDVDHIRIVDFAVDTGWKPTLRTNGFANAHYHAGWFRVANGKTVRMYRADGTQLVLLPPTGNGSAVLLETHNPEEFVREVKKEWSKPS